jgi:hypothetical protein
MPSLAAMRTSLALLILLAGQLFASQPGAEPTSSPETTPAAVAPKKASPADLKSSEPQPKKTAAVPQANARIREGRRPLAPNTQRPAYLFM